MNGTRSKIPGVTGQVWIYQGLTTLYGSLVGVRQWTVAEIALLPGGGGGDGTAPLAITVPITMNVRTGPGTDYDVVRIVPQGTQGRIWGIDPNDDWFMIELEGLDTYVWVFQDLTTVIGSLAGVRIYTAAEIALLPALITQPVLLNARSGPGTQYEILATVSQGDVGADHGHRHGRGMVPCETCRIWTNRRGCRATSSGWRAARCRTWCGLRWGRIR